MTRAEILTAIEAEIASIHHGAAVLVEMTEDYRGDTTAEKCEAEDAARETPR